MSTTLRCEAFVLDPRPRYPLVITVKRYWHPEHCYTDDDALTLLTAHAISFSKEHWEPTLEHLYERLAAQINPRVKVRDVWCIDAPNHGHAAILNEEALTYFYDEEFSWEEYARCIHAVVAGLGTGIDVDFSKRKLVSIGHSMGAVAMILSDTYMPAIRWSSMILVEPFIGPKPPKGDPELDIGAEVESFMVQNALKRKDLWRNKEAALRTFQAMDGWDPRIPHIIVEHNLRDLPTLTYPDKSSGVTLSCPRDIEAACYRQRLTRGRGFNYFCHLAKKIPVHLIYADAHDFVPEWMPDLIVKGVAGKVASIVEMEDVGHLIVQMQPQRLAGTIYAALDQDASGLSGSATHVSSKL